MISRIVLYSLLPLFSGGVIYLCYRSENLLMFEWCNQIGLSGMVTEMRQGVISQNLTLPNWVIYSLPDALWLFSMLSAIMIVWNFSIQKHTIFWLFLIILIGLFSELGQLLRMVPGTFDLVDFFLIIISLFTPFMIFKNKFKFNT